ncbi:TetR/AcrR family transcriptional regulator [Microbacterium sp. YY-01]|uniref:TetR/AcrR family transcriptional regulator n=1 Tax=Microbacterium sp. YY-01 TaxID=3421634 RepID=UPI003D17A37F
MSTSTRSRENTRARLLEAAALVFAEVGLDGASVEAVCERAGFTRGAFYSNFASKDQLFLELATSVAEARLASVAARVTELASQGVLDTSDPVTLVQQVMDSAGDDRLSIMLLSEIRIRALRDPAFGNAYLAQESALIDSIAAIIGRVTDGGTIGIGMDARTAARLLSIIWEGTTVRGAMAGLDDDQLRQAGSRELGRMVELLVTRAD